MPNIIIMGASSGLGYGLAEHYVARGWNVGLAARRTEPLQELAAKAADGQRVETARIDVCRPTKPQPPCSSCTNASADRSTCICIARA